MRRMCGKGRKIRLELRRCVMKSADRQLLEARTRPRQVGYDE